MRSGGESGNPKVEGRPKPSSLPCFYLVHRPYRNLLSYSWFLLEPSSSVSISCRERRKIRMEKQEGSILEVFPRNWPCGDKSLFSTVSSAKSAAKEFSSPDGTLGVEMPVAGYEERGREWETDRDCGVRIAYGLFQDLDSATSILRQEKQKRQKKVVVWTGSGK